MGSAAGRASSGTSGIRRGPESGPPLGPASAHLPSVPLALHWHGAGEGEPALRAAWAAAAEAGAAFAYTEQLQTLELVLDLWERVPDAARQAGIDRAGVMEIAVRPRGWPVSLTAACRWWKPRSAASMRHAMPSGSPPCYGCAPRCGSSYCCPGRSMTCGLRCAWQQALPRCGRRSSASSYGSWRCGIVTRKRGRSPRSCRPWRRDSVRNTGSRRRSGWPSCRDTMVTTSSRTWRTPPRRRGGSAPGH